jgi:hypothetical protein
LLLTFMRVSIAVSERPLILAGRESGKRLPEARV